VQEWFTLPAVRLVTAHGTCSCGFPHFIADEPVVYEEWLAPVLAQADDREADVRSARALLELVERCVRKDGLVELYPVGDGSDHLAPKGTVQLTVENLVAEQFIFTEQFFYRVSALLKEVRR
jgi:hypothetical protein